MSFYTLFRKDAARGKGGLAYPEMVYNRRVYEGLIKEVKQYYNRAPKAVESNHLLAQLLLHIPIRMDYDDLRFLRYAQDLGDNVARSFKLTTSSVVGAVHPGITLGPHTQEVLISSSEDFDLNQMKRNWRSLAPLRHLYHTRTDVNLPIMNNTTPGKGYGVTVVNIGMMALQYRYWLKEQVAVKEQKESIARFIGGYVLPNAIDSYLDIALFNRLSRLANGIGTPTYPTPHPFYLTDMVARLDRVNKSVLERLKVSKDIEAMADEIPMIVSQDLRQVIQLPKDPVTRQNEWALALARLPYVKFLVQETVKNGRGDRQYLNEVQISLLEAKWSNLHGQINNAELAKTFKQQLDGMLELLG